MTKQPEPQTISALPTDLFVGGRDKFGEYAKQIHACRQAAAKRIDVSYQLLLALPPEKRERGFVPLLVEQFAEHGHEINRQTLSDDIKIFRVLRLGLGVSRADVERMSYRRLRVLAQNEAWTLKNAEQARAMLADTSLGEEEMRSVINGGESKAPASRAVLVRFRMPQSKANVVAKALSSVATDLKKAGKEVPEDDAGLMLALIEEWRALKKAAPKPTKANLKL